MRLNIIYNTFPRHPNAGRSDSPATSPHWLISAVEGMRALAARDDTDNQCPEEGDVRIKAVDNSPRGMEAYVLKFMRNQQRVFLSAIGGTVHAQLSRIPSPDFVTGKCPRYPGPLDRPNLFPILKFSTREREIHKLAYYLTRAATERTYYFAKDYARIPVRAHLVDLDSTNYPSFFCAQIRCVGMMPAQDEDKSTLSLAGSELRPVPAHIVPAEWRLMVKEDQVPAHLVRPGNYLIYKSAHHADIVTERELATFYEVQ